MVLTPGFGKGYGPGERRPFPRLDPGGQVRFVERFQRRTAVPAAVTISIEPLAPRLS